MTALAINPCATCGACCRSYVVPVFGHDVWSIVSQQRLSPEQFLVVCPEKEPRPEAFLLEAEEQWFSLALDKKGVFALKKPCVFLMELPGNNDRCGIYADRPVVCQSYPMSLWSGVVTQRRNTLCPPDSWPLAQVMHPSWRTTLQRLCMHVDIYGEVVARWNARVMSHPGVTFSLPEYFSYLLNVYERLAWLAGELGPSFLAEVEATWPTFPRQAIKSVEALNTVGDTPWLRYFTHARQVIDSFYPHVPPQAPAFRAAPESTSSQTDLALPPPSPYY